MKQLFQSAVTLSFIVILFTSCKKDDAGDKAFDPNNPVGFMVSGTYKHDFLYPTVNQPLIMKFVGDNKIEYTTFSNTTTKSYRMSNDTFYIAGNQDEQFVIKNGVVTAYYYATDIRGINLKLLRVPGNNQLDGKTFAGVYYKPDGTVLHNSFFYTFDAGLKLNAGFTVGTPTRTNDYGSIANIASRSYPGAGQTEFTLLMDGKLYAVYYTNSNNTMQYALLDPK